MSGEFGEYGNCGYFDTKIKSAAEDCEHGNSKLTKLWGKLLEDMIDVSHSISWYEACDSSYYNVIMETIKVIPRIRKRLDDIENEVEIYERIIEDVVRERLE